MKPLAILPAAACVLSLAACGTTTVSRTSPPASATAAIPVNTASPVWSPPSSSPPASTTGKVGTTFQVTDSTDGWAYSVTLVKVLDPAQPDNSFDAADAGKHLVGAEFTLKGTTGNATDDSNNDAAVQGSDDQIYSPAFTSLAAGTNFNTGTWNLRPGSTETGWVTFEVPDGVTVANVQWNPAGSDSSPATWVIGS